MLSPKHKAPRLSICILILGLALIILLPGCAAVGPDYEPPKIDMPAAWQKAPGPAHSPDQKDIHQWWQVFNDPLLSSLMERATKGNLDLKSAYARVKEARHLVGVSTGGAWPSVGASGQSVRQHSSANDVTPGGITSSRQTLQADATWEIDLFGRIRRSIEAAKAQYQASEEDRAGVMVTLYAEVARVYLAVRTAQARQAATTLNIASQKEVLTLTEVRFKNGLATGLDVSQAEQVLAGSEAEVPPIRIALAQNVNALAVLLGMQPGALRDELAVAKPIPVPPKEVVVGVPADLLRRRPDIRRSERLLAAATARVGVATADLYPSFTIFGTIGLAATNVGDLFAGGGQFYSFGPSFKWNLFQGGAIRSQIKVESARTEQALLAYEQTVLTALSEVENALVSFMELQNQVLALGRAVKASRRTLELSIRLYKEGLNDFQSVLDAQRSMFSNDDRLASAKGQTASALVGLYKSLGGGWQATDKTKAAKTAPSGQTK